MATGGDERDLTTRAIKDGFGYVPPRESEHIVCRAKYKNYRRFEVRTDERYSLPHPGRPEP